MTYPVETKFEYPKESSRWLAVATLLLFVPKVIILVPHFVMLWILSIASFFAAIIGNVVVLFTAQYPKTLFDFVAGVLRWRNNVSAYAFGLVDKYPPFSL